MENHISSVKSGFRYGLKYETPLRSVIELRRALRRTSKMDVTMGMPLADIPVDYLFEAGGNSKLYVVDRTMMAIGSCTCGLL